MLNEKWQIFIIFYISKSESEQFDICIHPINSSEQKLKATKPQNMPIVRVTVMLPAMEAETSSWRSSSDLPNRHTSQSHGHCAAEQDQEELRNNIYVWAINVRREQLQNSSNKTYLLNVVKRIANDAQPQPPPVV